MDQTLPPLPGANDALIRARAGLANVIQGILVPLLAVFTAVVIGAVFILLAGLDPFKAYLSLLQGSLGTDGALTRSLVKMTPLILSGLAVAFAFKGGLFNIGAQGQLVVGALCSAWAGFAITGLPPVIHVPLALLAGMVGGMLWAMIPGLLKAYTGAHEVIVTIMLNYVASLLLEWAVAAAGPFRNGVATPPPGPLAACRTIDMCALGKTPPILPSAYLPVLYQPGGNATDTIHLGVLIAIVAALIIMVVLYNTTFGFEVRMVGLNPSAARYSGINVKRLTVTTMMISGLLAGMAGAIQTQGVNHEFQINQSLTTGFDSIAVALLAGSSPVGIIPSAFLFGAMNAGASQMQLDSHVPVDLIQILQALILMFVAADQIIRQLYRIRMAGSGLGIRLSTGWGQR
ncbi:MAG TPA: ABC transporter permease [Aggregatilineales bacterium]|nr:ABC transporter permease [Aggregatilineales bacterium]